MEESPIVREWTAQALAKGLQQGLQQGRQEGLELSREKLRGGTLRVWRARFTDPVPPEVLNAVQTQADVEALSRWFDAVLGVATEDEARRAILG